MPSRPSQSRTRAGAQQLGSHLRERGLVQTFFVPAVLLALVVYLSLASPVFLTADNLTNLLIQASTLAIVSFGVTFVVLVGEFDLSVGSGVALVSVVAAIVMKDTGSIAIGAAAALGVGAVIGTLNGLIVTRLRVSSFITTLGALVICQGLALHFAAGGVIAGLPDGVGFLTDVKLLGLELVIWLTFAVFACLLFLQTQSAFGIRVMATGGNREAARISGVPTNRIRFACFVLSGLTVGIAGMALLSRVESGQPNAGGLLELMAIAAIALGGTSLTGGKGSVLWTLWGVLLITTLQNGLDLEGVQTEVQDVIIGIVFIAAASSELLRTRLDGWLARGGNDPGGSGSAPLPNAVDEAVAGSGEQRSDLPTVNH